MNLENIVKTSFSFEFDGVKMTDTPNGVFLKDGRPFLGLFHRASAFSAAPMAITATGNVFVIVACDIKGLFSKSVHLTLKDQNNEERKLEIPIASLMMDSEITGKFLAWAKLCSPLIHPPGLNFVVLSKCFFARNTNL